MRSLLVLTVFLLLADSAFAQRQRGACTGEPTDSVTMAVTPIYRDCEVDRPAKVRSAIRPFFRPASSGLGTQCYRTELEFVVNAEGRPELDDVRVVSGNSPDLAEAVRAALLSVQYDPAILDGQPVRQRVRLKWSVATRVVRTRAGAPVDPGRAPRC